MYKLVKGHLIYFGVYYPPITAGIGPANYWPLSIPPDQRPGVGSGGQEQGASEGQNQLPWAGPLLGLGPGTPQPSQCLLPACGGPFAQFPASLACPFDLTRRARQQPGKQQPSILQAEAMAVAAFRVSEIWKKLSLLQGSEGSLCPSPPQVVSNHRRSP